MDSWRSTCNVADVGVYVHEQHFYEHLLSGGFLHIYFRAFDVRRSFFR